MWAPLAGTRNAIAGRPFHHAGPSFRHSHRSKACPVPRYGGENPRTIAPRKNVNRDTSNYLRTATAVPTSSCRPPFRHWHESMSRTPIRDGWFPSRPLVSSCRRPLESHGNTSIKCCTSFVNLGNPRTLASHTHGTRETGIHAHKEPQAQAPSYPQPSSNIIGPDSRPPAEVIHSQHDNLPHQGPQPREHHQRHPRPAPPRTLRPINRRRDAPRRQTPGHHRPAVRRPRRPRNRVRAGPHR